MIFEQIVGEESITEALSCISGKKEHLLNGIYYADWSQDFHAMRTILEKINKQIIQSEADLFVHFRLHAEDVSHWNELYKKLKDQYKWYIFLIGYSDGDGDLVISRYDEGGDMIDIEYLIAIFQGIG